MTELVPNLERPLAEEEVAQLLGVSRNTLKHWRWVGRGPRYVKLVRKIVYRPKDIAEWIDGNVAEPGAAT